MEKATRNSSKTNPPVSHADSSNKNEPRVERRLTSSASPDNSRDPLLRTPARSSCDHYFFGRVIGQGAYAVVRTAVHTLTHSDVAIKT